MPSLLCSLLLSLAFAAAPPTPRELFEGEKYAASLREIARILSRRDLPPGEDRVELLLLRAECQMRLGSMSLATAALRDAVEADQPGPRRDRSESLLILLRETTRFVYVPARRPGQPTTRPLALIQRGRRDLAVAVFFGERVARQLCPDERELALQALLGDRVAEQRKSIALVLSEKAEGAVARKAADIAALLPLERTVAGGETVARELLGVLGDFANRQAMATHDSSRKILDELRAASLEIVEDPNGSGVPRGLTGAIKEQAGDAARACQRAAGLIDQAATFSDDARRETLAATRELLRVLHGEIVEWAKLDGRQ